MLQITEQQLAQADAAATAAEQGRTDAESQLSTQPFSEIAAKRFTEAAQQAARLASAARRMRAEWEEQQDAARNDRKELEKAAAKQIGQADKELKTSRSRVVAAATAAQRALVELMDAAAAHDTLVRGHSAALAEKDLTFREGGGQEHETGATRTGLRVRGQWWLPVDAGTVAGWLTFQVAAARLPRMHTLIGALTPCRRLVEARTDGLFAGIEQPERLHFPERPRLVRPPSGYPVSTRKAS